MNNHQVKIETIKEQFLQRDLLSLSSIHDDIITLLNNISMIITFMAMGKKKINTKQPIRTNKDLKNLLNLKN